MRPSSLIHTPRGAGFLLLLALALIVTAGVYRSGLHGGFLFDDFPNIVDNRDLQIHDLKPTDLA
ncbi:MAG TPA: hypothetical protein VF265_06105, partial [Nevskiaceae bacterium]